MKRKAFVLLVCAPLLTVCDQHPAGETPGPAPEPPPTPTREVSLDISPVDPAAGALLVEIQSADPRQWVQRCVPGAERTVHVPNIAGGAVEVAASTFAGACPIADGARPLSVSEIVGMSVPDGSRSAAALVLGEVGAGDDAATDLLAQCPVGQQACTLRDGSLRCTDVSRDRANCGRCGRACTRMQRCEQGVCTGGPTCSGGLSMCTVADGTRRCVDTRVDMANCGGCGRSCTRDQRCMNGACASTAPACPSGLTACTGADGRRRCVDTRVDMANCGGCGRSCTRDQRCMNGACASTAPACPSGLTACTGADGRRRCVDTRVDMANCGGCGRSCTRDQRCMNGACASTAPACPSGLTACTGADGRRQCVDTRVDMANCGGCGRSCTRDQRCMNGACASTAPACPSGLTACTGADGRRQCVDTRVDMANCGGCGRSCTRDQRCMNGACVSTAPACAPDTARCTGVDGRQQCIDVRSNPFHCGRCGNVCPVTQRRCRDGVCT